MTCCASFEATAYAHRSASEPPFERIVIRDGKVTRKQASSVRPVTPSSPLRPTPPAPASGIVVKGVLGPGTIVAGRYELTRVVGEGGSGVVWEAMHTLLRRPVALKVLKSSEPDAQRRFFREARVTGALRHPNIVTAYDVFVVPGTGTPAIVMEMLDGAPLAKWTRRADGRSCALPFHQVARILLPVVSALRAAHAAGIVHRDLKPENIFLVGGLLETPQVKVLDFGLAKITAANSRLVNSSPITSSSLLGTLHYMAPEQVSGDVIEGATDVWALGVVLYELLSGARPIDGRNVTQIFRDILEAMIVPLEQVVRVPGRIAGLASRMLSRVPAERPSLDEVHAVLAEHAAR